MNLKDKSFYGYVKSRHTKVVFGLFLIMVILFTMKIRHQHSRVHDNTIIVTRTDLMYPDSIGRSVLCVQIPNYVKYGGIETWMDNFLLIMQDMKFLSIGVWITMVRSDKVYDKVFKNNKVFQIKSQHEVRLYCDYIFMNAHFPIKGLHNTLVIHGGSHCPWTNRYSTSNMLYDQIVGVSSGSLQNIENQNQIMIPTFVVNRTNNYQDQTLFCEHQLLFVGRLASDKRPDIFCNLIKKSKKYCGVMVGPTYFDNFRCDSPKIYLVGDTEEVGSFFESSEALLITSDDEGGPIVAVESWLYKKPTFMTRIGIANVCPEAFIIVERWDNVDDQLIDVGIKKWSQNLALDCYQNNFSFQAVRKKWENLIITIEAKIFNRYQPVKILNSICRIEYLGKMLTINGYFSECGTTFRVYGNPGLKQIIDTTTLQNLQSVVKYSQTNCKVDSEHDRLFITHDGFFCDISVTLKNSQISLSYLV